jgi:orotate phosphoribosyltransferase
MDYRSVDDLSSATKALLPRLTGGVDLVVSASTEGLFPATLVSLSLDVSATDVEGLGEGRVFQSGRRDPTAHRSVDDPETVLVVIDTVRDGTRVAEVRSRVESLGFDSEVRYCGIFVTPEGRAHVDHWAEVVPEPCLFEWELFHHPRLKRTCVDIDGVLCRDPFPEENDDGRRYRAFLEGVEPRVTPSEEIGWLVTSRLEKYRPETEAWLSRHGIRYDELVMLDLPNRKARLRRGDHGAYKAGVYDATDAELFIESDGGQALTIARETGKPVYCPEANELLVGPDPSFSGAGRDGRGAGAYLDRFRRNPVGFAAVALRSLSTRLTARVRP